MLNLLPKKGCAARSLMATSCCERASSRSYSFVRAKLKDLGLMFLLDFNRLILSLQDTHRRGRGIIHFVYANLYIIIMYANFCQ